MLLRHTFTNKDIEWIESVAKKTDFVLLGEIHGVAENVHLLASLSEALAKHRKIILAFEWLFTPEETSALNRYVQCQGNTLPQSPFLIDSDGRFMKEHLAYLKEVRSGIIPISSIFCFDDISFIDDRDYQMAKRLSELKEYYPEHLILVETGVVHAQKKPGLTEDQPMGAVLSKEHSVTSIFLRYQNGSVVVDGEQYDIRDAASQIEGPGDAFDIEFVIPVAHPAKMPVSLTEISTLIHSE